MKTMLLILSLVYSFSIFGACSSPISRTNSSPNTVLTSTKYNTDINTVYTKVNELDGDCITDATIATAKLENDSVTRAKLATGAIAQLSVVAKTSNYTAADEDVITVDATSGAVTITLPTANGISGKTYTIKKTDTSVSVVTVDGNASETIDGATTVSLFRQYQFVEIVSNGTNWVIINGHKCSSEFSCAPSFSATVSSSGVVSGESVDGFNGNCSKGGTGIYNCPFNSSVLTLAPNCIAITVNTGITNGLTANICKPYGTGGTTSTTIQVRCYTDASASSATAADDVEFNIFCQKSGADYTSSKL